MKNNMSNNRCKIKVNNIFISVAARHEIYHILMSANNVKTVAMFLRKIVYGFFFWKILIFNVFILNAFSDLKNRIIWITGKRKLKIATPYLFNLIFYLFRELLIRVTI